MKNILDKIEKLKLAKEIARNELGSFLFAFLDRDKKSALEQLEKILEEDLIDFGKDIKVNYNIFSNAVLYFAIKYEDNTSAMKFLQRYLNSPEFESYKHRNTNSYRNNGDKRNGEIKKHYTLISRPKPVCYLDNARKGFFSYAKK